MANAALQNQGRNNKADQRFAIVNSSERGQGGRISQGFAPAPKREDYTIGPDGIARRRPTGKSRMWL